MNEPPPLGLKPKSVHDTERAFHITEAINRYLAADKPVPPEWIDELRDIACKSSRFPAILPAIGRTIVITAGEGAAAFIGQECVVTEVRLGSRRVSLAYARDPHATAGTLNFDKVTWGYAP